ncbi:unnamed protein product [Phytophthora fragariaefolia]|uniref:Unnamed protein product n=1 Tax=Phytophthora fragariaefolia TaxID=1490495 RepID=A0A9W6XHQ9_9STRA|nr:unnamed protein product [Phytophthora fragariaefolia]
MRWGTSLLALLAPALRAFADEVNPDHLTGDVWEDGLLRYRVVSDTVVSENVTTADLPLALMGASDDTNFCTVKNTYTLAVTVSKCLPSSEYEKLWSLKLSSISNARLSSVSFTYLDCSTSVGAPSAITAVSGPPRMEVMKGKTTPTVAGAVAVRVCPNLDCSVLPTDIVLAILPSVDLVVPTPLTNLVDCSKELTNAVSYGDGQSGACKCQCPNTPFASNGNPSFCSCASPKGLLNGSCQTCPNGRVNGVCTCSGSNMGWIGSICSTCPSGSSVMNSVCTCSAGREMVDGQCTCPSTSTFDGSACVCLGGQSLVNNVCTCPSTSTLTGTGVSAVCQCPGSTGFINGVCSTCPSGSSIVNGACTAREDDHSSMGSARVRQPRRSMVVRAGQCSCPDGQEYVNDKCESLCFWRTNNVGYACSWTDRRKTSLMLTEDCKINAPAALDNYVADKRSNKYDLTLSDPVISITATKQDKLTGVTRKTSWRNYLLSPTTLENEIKFSTFGVFNLLMTASDYDKIARCSGCVAIVDNYPPTAEMKCQTTVSNTLATAASYKDGKLNEAIAQENKFTDFYSNGNIKNNDVGSSEDTGANERCDDLTAEMQDFFTSSVSKLASVDSRCFDNNFAGQLLDRAPKTNPLVSGTQSDLDKLQCMRCCSKALTLKEYYYDYKCGSDSTNTEKKIATSDQCGFDYCLSMPSDTLVSASAAITDSVARETTTVLGGLPTSVAPASNVIHRTYHDTFTVVLHPHSPHNVCDTFNQLWIENSPTPRTNDQLHMCTYPGSDFVMMTFTYDSESDSTHIDDTVKGKYTDVKCYVRLTEGGSSNPESVKEAELPLAWAGTNSEGIQISKQLALELVNDPETAKTTDVLVRCDFTFKYFNSDQTTTDPCRHPFTIKDCDAPELKTSNPDACSPPSSFPGPFEACNGDVFTTVSDQSQVLTELKTVNDECCSKTLSCVSLRESVTDSGVKRCEASPPAPMVAMELRVDDEAGGGETRLATSASPSMVELFAASSLVAVVALIVVKQRMAGAARGTREMDDVYVTLLD